VLLTLSFLIPPAVLASYVAIYIIVRLPVSTSGSRMICDELKPSAPNPTHAK
jgi:hypothetical protein